MLITRENVARNARWLRENASPPVRYLAYRDLPGMDPGPETLAGLFAQVEQGPLAKEIFSKQQPDGSWCSGGPWAMPPSYLPGRGYSLVSPKYVTTVWLLAVLGDMGFTAADSRVLKACRHVLSFQEQSGFIPECRGAGGQGGAAEPAAAPCHFSIILAGLGKAGAGNGPGTEDACRLLLKWQREDGGWALQQHIDNWHWTRSCPYSTCHAMTALYSCGKGKYSETILRALGFLVWHLSIKKESDIRRFFYHGHLIVQELLALSDYGVFLDEKPVQAVLGWLMSMYDPDAGHFHYAGKPPSQYSLKEDFMDARVARYRLFHLAEDDWLTYYMTRVMANILRQDG